MTKVFRSLALVPPCLAALCFIGLASPVRADVIESIAAAPGTNLSDIHVGDQLTLRTTLSSTDPGEHFQACCDVHIFWSSFDMELVSAVFASPVFGVDISTNPVLVDWNFLAVAPSQQEAFNGWSDCFGLPTNNSGCAVTNLGSFRPADSNHLIFTIWEAPEPPSALLLPIGLLAVLALRKRSLRTSARIA